MKSFTRWLLINIFLPFSPILIRIFVSFMSKKGLISFSQIAELPEILFYSIYLCVINLNINLDGKKNYFEFLLRIFLVVLLVADFIILGMIYSSNVGFNVYPFSLVSVVFPLFIAPIYKFKYSRNFEKFVDYYE